MGPWLEDEFFFEFGKNFPLPWTGFGKKWYLKVNLISFETTQTKTPGMECVSGRAQVIDLQPY